MTGAEVPDVIIFASGLICGILSVLIGQSLGGE